MSLDDYAGEWITWCSIRAGNDGRRPSGVVWQRTKYKHFAKTTTHTLCNRDIGSLATSRELLDNPPECKICRRRLSGN